LLVLFLKVCEELSKTKNLFNTKHVIEQKQNQRKSLCYFLQTTVIERPSIGGNGKLVVRWRIASDFLSAYEKRKHAEKRCWQTT